MASLHGEDNGQPDRSQKERQSADGSHLSEPQKAHPTGESHKMVVAVRYFICSLSLQQWSGRAGQGRQAKIQVLAI